MKKISIFLLCLIFLTGCNKKENIEIENNNKGDIKVINQVEGFKEGNIKAKMKTNMGDIDLILFPNVAPKSVENFVTHSKNGYYDGATFHRVIEDFMIQGGDPDGTGMGGESIWNEDFQDEFDLYYRNIYGALSMANAGPNTNGSQFFIVTTKDNISKNMVEEMRSLGEEQGYPDAVIDAYEKYGGAYHLDFRHTVFGHVVEGMDIVEKISKVKTDQNDKPINPVTIESIEIEE